MAESVIFDTHRFVKRMTEAGMASPVAEALAEEHVQLLECNLSTKQDIAHLDVKLEAKLADVEKEIADIRKAIAETNVEIIKWNLGTLLALAALGVAVLAAWPQ